MSFSGFSMRRGSVNRSFTPCERLRRRQVQPPVPGSLGGFTNYARGGLHYR